MEEQGTRPLVTVYIPSHNYGHYLPEAIESVLGQSLSSWEMILIDDGSRDETRRICEQYARDWPERIRVLVHEEAQGLQRSANRAIEEARGKYVMRLDGDDWLDESALLVMSERLEGRPEVAMVYPNYFYVDARGALLGVENRKKVGKEARLLDLPPHGACTMVRRRILRTLGGYDEEQKAQDGYELWLKISPRYEVESIGTPLFYYRQHEESLSRDEERILEARRGIKRRMVERLEGRLRPRVLGIIPAKNTYKCLPNIALEEVGGRPLLEYTLESARATRRIDALWVSTDCERVQEFCEARDVRAMRRPAVLSGTDRRLSEVVHEAVMRLEKEEGVYADIVVVLSAHSPLRRTEDIEKALDSLILYDADSVISVYEDYDVHFSHGAGGLEPINPAMMTRLRLEREGLYVYNGAISAFWRDVLTKGNYHGERISHVVMPRSQSYQLKSEWDRFILDQILTKNGEEEHAVDRRNRA